MMSIMTYIGMLGEKQEQEGSLMIEQSGQELLLLTQCLAVLEQKQMYVMAYLNQNVLITMIMIHLQANMFNVNGMEAVILKE